MKRLAIFFNGLMLDFLLPFLIEGNENYIAFESRLNRDEYVRMETSQHDNLYYWIDI